MIYVLLKEHSFKSIDLIKKYSFKIILRLLYILPTLLDGTTNKPRKRNIYLLRLEKNKKSLPAGSTDRRRSNNFTRNALVNKNRKLNFNLIIKYPALATQGYSLKKRKYPSLKEAGLEQGKVEVVSEIVIRFIIVKKK